MKLMKKLKVGILAVSLVAGLSACGGNGASHGPTDIAADLTQGQTAAVALWDKYLDYPNCATPEGEAQKPACVESAVVALVAPKREASYNAIAIYTAGLRRDETYCLQVLDPDALNACLDAASGPPPTDETMAALESGARAALELFRSLAKSLPQKGAV